MNLHTYLTIAGVPAALHPQASAALAQCRSACRGLAWAKWRVRLFKAGQIARMIPWQADRLTDVRPDLADWDIEPVLNVTAHGDNVPWIDTPSGGRPQPHCWLDADPQSDEYRQAVAACYWAPGQHPRSTAAVKAWYRRNAGAALAYRLGAPVDEARGHRIWRGQQGRTSVVVLGSGAAWQIIAETRLALGWKLRRRWGHEVANVFSGVHAPQAWYALAGTVLRAPVSWTTLPTREAALARKDQFDGVEQTPRP
jgi:hypothetical protein